MWKYDVLPFVPSFPGIPCSPCGPWIPWMPGSPCGPCSPSLAMMDGVLHSLGSMTSLADRDAAVALVTHRGLPFVVGTSSDHAPCPDISPLSKLYVTCPVGNAGADGLR